MKRFSTLIIPFVFVLGAVAPTTLADPLQWNLSTLTFSATSFPPGGAATTGTVTGSFTYDANTNVYTTWSIDISGFPGTAVPASGLLLTPADTSIAGFCTGCNRFSIYDPAALSPFWTLLLDFTQPLTDAGGTVSINDTFFQLNAPNFATFRLQGPSGSVSAVPEPSSAALILVVAIGFGTLFLRRFRHSRPNR
jgi:hypothetical protein